MAILLRDFIHYHSFLELEHGLGEFKKIEFKIGDINTPKHDNGLFYESYGNTLGIYGYNEKGYILVNTCTYQVESDIDIILEIEDKDRARLSLIKHEKIVENVIYRINEGKLENDPTPFLEEEDFNFGLFIKNIINYDERFNLLRHRS